MSTFYDTQMIVAWFTSQHAVPICMYLYKDSLESGHWLLDQCRIAQNQTTKKGPRKWP